MNTLQFLLTFSVLTVISSTAIVGWYLSTRGEWTITPDGKWKKTGMIFKYWSLFFEQYRKTKTVYYAGAGLREKMELLGKVHPQITALLEDKNDSVYLLSKDDLTATQLSLIKDCLLCGIEVVGKRIKFFAQEPVYDWPEWIQKPLSSCATCMAGPYGTAIWLVFLKLQRGAFDWTDSRLLAKICFYIIFLLTLASCNSLLSKKLKL
jgi:hypothetical protein